MAKLNGSESPNVAKGNRNISQYFKPLDKTSAASPDTNGQLIDNSGADEPSNGRGGHDRLVGETGITQEQQKISCKPAKQKEVNGASKTSRWRYDPNDVHKVGAHCSVEQLSNSETAVDLRCRLVEDQVSEATPSDEDPADEEVALLNDERESKRRKTSRTGKTAKLSLTPLEEQYTAFKKQHPDLLLLVEVGYKFRFFGDDAIVASKELGIAHFKSHNFYTASIPVHRLNVHVKRLVTAGYKVGVCRQIETAGLKAFGSNKSKPFRRDVTNIYTKATFIDDVEITDDSDMLSSSGYIMCLAEQSSGVTAGTSHVGRVMISMICLQPSTGSIIYDHFQDGLMREEMHTRLEHLLPCELVLAGDISEPTRKILSHYTDKGTGKEIVRIDTVPSDDNIEHAQSYVLRYAQEKILITKKSNCEDAVNRSNNQIQLLQKVSDRLIPLYSTLLRYLRQFELDTILLLSSNMETFVSQSTMVLNASALINLEIFHNLVDFKEKGSLFWVIDHTRTKFGKRLLQKWLGRPLLDPIKLKERLDMIHDILNMKDDKVEKLTKLLTRLPDLERTICRIYYGRCSRPELLQVLQTFRRIAAEFPPVERLQHIGFASPALNRAVANFSSLKNEITFFLEVINFKETAEDDKCNMFKENDSQNRAKAIQEQKLAIIVVESELQTHLEDIRKSVKHSKLNYVKVAGIEYLIELPNREIAHVPPSWVKVGGTKSVSRFHTPTIIQLLKERDRRKELLIIECDKAFESFLKEISVHFEQFSSIVKSLALIDCILSLASVANLPGYCCPHIVEQQIINLTNARHPIVEQTLSNVFVPNDIKMDCNGETGQVITGPNMGGKSCYVRTVALITIMAQIGCYVPCQTATLGLFDGVYTRMGASDNMLKGESTFMVEMSETTDIMRRATSHSLVILDEIGRGTATFDGYAIAQAVLQYFVQNIGSFTMFVTHYPQIIEVVKTMPKKIGAYHMGFIEEKGIDGHPQLTFLYTLIKGIAHRSYGLNVARLAGLPPSIIAIANQKARQLENDTRDRNLRYLITKIMALIDDNQSEFEVLMEHITRITDLT